VAVNSGPPSLTCPVCGGGAHDALVVLHDMPLVGMLFAASCAEAMAAERGTIDLVACRACGHIFNRTFEPARVAYTQDYENSLDMSNRHRAHTEAIVRSLIERHRLRDKIVVEIGCGSGNLLRQLCAHGANHGTGYDPSQPSQPRAPVGAGSVEIIGAYFADSEPHEADAICAQHVLEHLPRPVETLHQARRRLVPGGLGYFEVPNSDVIFGALNIWDLTYEHVSYFSARSLGRALDDAGFSPLRLDSTFGGQYLDAEAVAERRPAIALPETNFNRFPERFARIMTFWRSQLAEWAATRQRVVLWGAGTKAVSFLNMLGVHVKKGVDYVVDINPRKSSRYVPGTGQRIVAPDFLRDYRPDRIIIMNSEYRNEITAQLSELQVDGTVLDSVPTDS
jgi:SAM-dependent methyltransferase